MNNIEDDAVFKELYSYIVDSASALDVDPNNIPSGLSPAEDFKQVFIKSNVSEIDIPDLMGYVTRLHEYVQKYKIKAGVVDPKIIDAKVDKVPQATLESAGAPSDAPFVGRITPFDVLWASWSNETSKKNLETLLNMQFTGVELSGLLNAFKTSEKDDWKPIQKLSQEQIETMRTNVDTVVYHSVEFMSSGYKKVNALRTYSDTGVEYTFGTTKAKVYRGVPVSEEDAKTLSGWMSTSTKHVIVPFEPLANKRLGAMLCGVKQETTKMNGVNMHAFVSVEGHPLAATLRMACVKYLNDLLKENPTVTNTAKLVHIIQDRIMRDKALHTMLDKISAFMDKQWEKSNTVIDGEGKPTPRTFVAPIPDTIGMAVQTVGYLQTSKVNRNHGVGKDVWHRMLNNMPGANYDVHDAQLLQAMSKVTGNLAVLGGTDELLSTIRALKIADGVVEARFIAPGKVTRGECKEMLVLSMVKNTPKVTGSVDTHPVRAALLLSHLEDLKPGFKLHIRFNAMTFNTRESIENIEYRRSFAGWKYEGMKKSGGLHTPDGIHTFVKLDTVAAGIADVARRNFETKIRQIVGMATVCDAYMNAMVRHGQLGVKPDFTKMMITLGENKATVLDSKNVTFHVEVALGSAIQHISSAPPVELSDAEKADLISEELF